MITTKGPLAGLFRYAGCMSRYGGSRFKLWVGQPVNAAFVTPPASLRVVLVLCILSSTGVLLYGVANQLALGGSAFYSLEQAAFFISCYFLLPILIAHTIATNWPISRVLIVVYSVALAFQTIQAVYDLRLGPNGRGLVTGLVFISLLGVVWWLFGSKKLRIYYSLIVGDGIPDDIEGTLEEQMAPGRAEQIFGRLADIIGPYFEGAVIVIVFIALAYAIGG